MPTSDIPEVEAVRTALEAYGVGPCGRLGIAVFGALSALETALRTAAPLTGEGATLPTGTLVRLQRADGRHVALEAARCEHCGVAARVVVRYAEAPGLLVVEVPPGVRREGGRP